MKTYGTDTCNALCLLQNFIEKFQSKELTTTTKNSFYDISIVTTDTKCQKKI
jgi:hypothetical protein